MIWTPWALALTASALLLTGLAFRAAVPVFLLGFQKAAPDSAFHLAMEKQEMLFSAVIQIVSVTYLFSPVLLVMAAFDFSRLIPGAMCPTGVFNADRLGLPLLMIRLIGLFPLMAWGTLYSMDMQFPDTPFRKIRRVLMIPIFAWLVGDTVIQTIFFSRLNADSVTSCCAVVFDASQSGSFSMDLFSRFPSSAFFFTSGGLYTGLGLFGLIRRRAVLRIGYGLSAPLFFFFGIAAVTSCISPYIYALPHHHCPFCILSGKESLLGIPLMALVYIASLSGWRSGIKQIALKKIGAGQADETPLKISVAGNLIFITGSGLIVLYYRLFGQLI